MDRIYRWESQAAQGGGVGKQSRKQQEPRSLRTALRNEPALPLKGAIIQTGSDISTSSVSGGSEHQFCSPADPLTGRHSHRGWEEGGGTRKTLQKGKNTMRILSTVQPSGRHPRFQ